MHLMRSLFSFKRLRSTYLGREKIQQQQHQWPASFFFQISSTWSETRRRLRSRPSFAFFYDLWQCVEFHWLQAPLGVSLSVSFPFPPSRARVLDISPFALIKPDACYAGYNNLKRNQAIVSQVVF